MSDETDVRQIQAKNDAATVSSPILRAGLAVLVLWSLLTALLSLGERTSFRDGGLGRLFTGLRTSSILGFYAGWLDTISIAFVAITVAVAVVSIVALAQQRRRVELAWIASIGAAIHPIALPFFYTPFLGVSVVTFLKLAVPASLLPALGVALITASTADDLQQWISTRQQRERPGPIGREGMDFDEPASNGLRFGAYLLDGALFVVTLGIGWLVWSCVAWGRGQTPAKQLVGLRVIEVSSGCAATWGRMALREIVGKTVFGIFSLGLTTVVSFFTVLFGTRRQGVWDALATTMVVQAPRTFQSQRHS